MALVTGTKKPTNTRILAPLPMAPLTMAPLTILLHLLTLCLLWLHLLCSTYQDFLIVAGVVAMPRDELLLRMEHGDMQTVTGGAVLYPQVCPCPLLVQSTSTPTILALTTLLELLYLTYLRAYPTLLPYPLTLPSYPTLSCGRSPTPPTAHEHRSRSRSN